ncbi:MAG TPA: CBS domain-containing protein [Vicinamibacteria bacterium]|jgi:CBS domain-containing protein
MKVYSVSRRPAVTVPIASSVRDALQEMTREKVGGVVVVEEGKAAGIFTRRDALERVVLANLSLDSPLRSVMTSPVETLSKDTELADALKLMAARPFNHLPIVDAEANVVGLATTKRIMKETIEKLSDELGSLEAYIVTDGIGG